MFNALIAFAIGLFVLPQSVHAYLDPGNGSYLLQMGIGMVLGLLVSLRVFWGEVRRLGQRLLNVKWRGDSPKSE